MVSCAEAVRRARCCAYRMVTAVTRFGWASKVRRWSAAGLAASLGAGCATQPVQRVVDRSSPFYGARLQDQLDRVLEVAGPAVHLGALVVDAADGRVLYERQPDQRFVPASATKLFTAAAALFYLGPAYRFTTDLLGTPVADDPRQLSELYLRGSGDPSLRDSQLRQLASQLRQRGIWEIDGDLVVDDGAFDRSSWGRGWTWDDLAKGYATPVSGLNLMHNGLLVELWPGAAVGAPARLQTSPATAYAQVINNVQTGPTTSPVHVDLQGPRADSVGLELGDTVTLQGSLPQNPNLGWSRRLAVRDSALFAGTVLREQLQAVGIEVGGLIRRGSVPPEAQRLGTHRSAELGVLLTEFMKSSDNLGMECLLKRLGADSSGQPGSFANGLRALRAFAQQELGVDTADLRLADGSGNSRYDLLSPRQLVQLLVSMRQSFAAGPEFIAALPVAGIDGTLRNRLQQPGMQGAVRAKTGTMTAVSSLAGYLLTADNQVLVYAIMGENFLSTPGQQRQLQDAFLTALARAK
jgi:D-alanyl-D-alanine carboxypeptidase/D-alanyl-D-alanine-endopeptidase (penicillin-binding protein 4)